MGESKHSCAGKPGRNAERCFALALLAVYLLLLAFNLMTPMAGDDYAHYYGISGEHVDTIPEIRENLQNLWLHINGRVAAHLMVYLLQIPPRAVFCLLNAAVLPLLLLLLQNYLPQEQRRLWGFAVVAAMLLWLCIPAFGEVFLWLTGSCNYGWSLPLLLWSLAPFYRAALGTERKMGIWGSLLHALACLLCGFYSEIGGIGLLASAFLLLVMSAVREKRLPLQLLLSFLLGCAGFLLMLTAPSTLSSRTGGVFSFHQLAVGLKTVITALREYFLPLLLLYALLFAWTWARGGDKKVLGASCLLLAGAMAPALALSTAAYLVARSFTVTGLLSVLACLMLMGELVQMKEKTKLASVAAVLTVLFAFSFLAGTGDILSLCLQARERNAIVRSAQDSGESSVMLPAYVTTTPHSEIRDEGLASSPDYWYNQELAQYYGFDAVYGILPGDEGP